MQHSATFDISDDELDARWPPIEVALNSASHVQRVPIFWHGEGGTSDVGSYLVKGLLPVNGIALLAGQSGAGKTFAALDLAGSLALAEPFFGRKIRAAGGTLFLAAEAIGTIGERIDAMHRGRSLDRDTLPIAWREVSCLNNPATMEALTADAIAIGGAMQERHHLPLSLVVVDTLAAAFAFDDENDAAQATRAMQSLAALSAKTGALVLALAHFGKTSETGVRGSSAFTASADAILAALVERDNAGKVQSRQLALTKSRRTETGWNCPFVLEPVAMGQDEDGEPVFSCYVAPQVNEAKLSTEPKSKGMTKTARAYQDALQIVLGDNGTRLRPFGGDGPEVLTADRDDVRTEFYRRYPADGDEKQRAEVRRKAFNRGEADARACRAVEVLEIHNVQRVWSLAS